MPSSCVGAKYCVKSVIDTFARFATCWWRPSCSAGPRRVGRLGFAWLNVALTLVAVAITREHRKTV
jgi:hypothetical protein